ncbi:MAG: hypothetical protein R3345_13300, partial [Fulvivirga sp.]|nr:hypothetical protein [Fulvivirga sp.]
PSRNYTLNSLAEQVIRLLNSNRHTAEIKLDKREVVKQVRSIASELTRKRWYEVRSQTDVKHLGQLYLAEFTGVSVEKDTSTGKNFCWLPAHEEDLPDGTGIQSVIPEHKNKEKNDPVIPIPPNASVIISTLRAGALEQRWGYEPKRDRLVFTKRKGKTMLEEGIKTVTVNMVVALADTIDDPDQPIPFPSDLLPELLRRTLSIFGLEKKFEEDLVNDNQ